MRVIAGSARRRNLVCPSGEKTRPTTDRIKETLFNMLQNDVPGSYFLDLFAGTGQIGLEALSRGARYCVFVENQKKAAACIEDNISFTKSDKESTLLTMDVLPALRSLEGKYQFDIIFMDPPYKQLLEREVLTYLSGSSLLKEDTLIVVEADQKEDFSYVEELGFYIKKDKIYKTNRHLFLNRR